jgi:hypothetical protein
VQRPSDISTAAEFRVEHWRESIRDRRWDRRRAVMLDLAAALRTLVPGLLASVGLLGHLLGWY